MEGEDIPENIDIFRADDGFNAGEFVPIQRMPEKFRDVFANYMCFNKIQSDVFNDVFETDASLVVSSPTGSGKTVVFELAICRLLKKYDLHQMDYNFMIIYVAPIKSLCEERVLDWHKKFSPLGINCILVTGDSDVVSVQHLSNHNLIITTPEKWDSLTRRWRNNIGFMNRVALFMIDEVHLLNDEQRGPTLEAIMSRMKTIEDSKKENLSAELLQTIRFLAISATIPNVEDIAEWIGTRAMPAKYFNDEARPVKLKKIVLGYYYNPQMSTPFKFDIMLSYKLQGIILQYSDGKPTLIFCSTRKSVEMTTKHLSQNLTISLDGGQKAILQQAASRITTPAVKEILVHGIGCHHAGMLPESRRIMETLFRNGDLPILVTTSTLAMGINLPAHLVIIKSTKHYSQGEYRDYSEGVLFQMIGRAGRPQFDTSANAVIMTTTIDKSKFDNMLGGTQNVESSLHKHLTEHLNAEIVLRTITNTEVAKQWLTSTFLHIRARKHPTHYGFSANFTQDQLVRKLMEMCQIEINKLERVGMIVIEDSVIMPTEMGSLMAKYCVHFDTMKIFRQVQGTEILQQVLCLISKSHEFSDLYLRVNDKKTLNLLNKCKTRETIRYPFSGKIKTLDMKINCIIQAVFGCLQILEPSLINEAQKIMKIGERLSKCLADYIGTRENGFSALLNTLILAKCFHCRIWENSPYISRQLSGIGAVMSAHLVLAGKTSFQSILETNPRNLEMILHRKPPMGDSIIRAVELLPQYIMRLEEEKVSSVKSKIKVFIQLVNAEKLDREMTIDSQSYMDLLIGDECNNILLHERCSHTFLIDNKEIEKVIPKEFTGPTTVMAHFISENWVGIDCTATLEINTININNNTKSMSNTQKKVNSSKVSKQVKKTDQSITISGKEKSYMKSFINQYFKIVKKVKTPEPFLNPAKMDFDEINLLEFEQDDLSSWEPLDDKLLDSSDDQRFDNYINECESNQITTVENNPSTAGSNNVINRSNTEVTNKNSKGIELRSNNDMISSGFKKENNFSIKSTINSESNVNKTDNLQEFINNTIEGELNENIDIDSGVGINDINTQFDFDLFSDAYEEEFSAEFFTQDALKEMSSNTVEPKTTEETKKKKFQFKKTSNKENVLPQVESYEDVFSEDMFSELKMAEERSQGQKCTKPPKIIVLINTKIENENVNLNTSTDKKITKKVQSTNSLCSNKINASANQSTGFLYEQPPASAAPIIEQLRGLIANKKNSIKKDEKEEDFEYSTEVSFNSIGNNQTGNRNKVDETFRVQKNSEEDDGIYHANNEQMNQYEEAMSRMKEYEDDNASAENDENHDILENNLGTRTDSVQTVEGNNQKYQRGNLLNNSTTDEDTPKPNMDLQKPLQVKIYNNSISYEQTHNPNTPKLQMNQTINPSIEQSSSSKFQRSIQPQTPNQFRNVNILNKPGNVITDPNQLGVITNPNKLYVISNPNQLSNVKHLYKHGNVLNGRNQFVIANSTNLNQRSNRSSSHYINSSNINQKANFIVGSNQFINNNPTPKRFILIQRNPNSITCEAQSSNMPSTSKLNYNPKISNQNQLVGSVKDKNEAAYGDMFSISEEDKAEEEFVVEMENQYAQENPQPCQKVETFVSDVRDLSASSCATISRGYLGNQSFQQRSASGESLRSCESVPRMRNAEPALESFSNLFQNRKKKMIVGNTMNFEKSILQDKSEIKHFAITPKKKISHTVTSNSLREENEREVPLKRLKMGEFSGYSQASSDKKSITWRSPLIVSPKNKYSPIKLQIFSGNSTVFPRRPEIHSSSNVLPPPPQPQIVISQPTRISFAQSPFIANPASQTYRNPTLTQLFYSQQARPKQTKRRMMLSNFTQNTLNTPKNLYKLPVTDQDCGYSQSTQHAEVTERMCNELSDFFSNSPMEVFKPEMSFVENDITNYVRQNQPAVEAKEENFEEGGQEWWNRPDTTEEQVKEELQRGLREIIKQSDSHEDYEELPYINENVSFGNQSQNNQLRFNYQPPDVVNMNMNPNMAVSQPHAYENYPSALHENFPNHTQAQAQWDFEQQQRRWEEVNRRRMLPQNPESSGYNTENRWDLMQKYLQTQAQQANFKDK